MKMRYFDAALAQGMRDSPPDSGGARHAHEPATNSFEPAKIDWGGYWRSIQKRRWIILAVALIATLLGVAYVQSVQPVFRSTATILIESGKTKILSIEEVYNGVSQDREYYQTQVEILRSRDVAMRAVIGAKLWDIPEFDPRKPALSWLARAKMYISPPPAPPNWTPDLLAEATVGKFLQAVTIEPVRLSQLIKISFDSTNRDLAAKMAMAIASSFIEADRDARLKLNLSVTGLLQDQLIALREKLSQSEQELQKFRESSGLVSTSGSQGIAGQQMAETSQRLVAARVRRTELESAYQQMALSGKSGTSSATEALDQPGLFEARNRVAQAALQLENLSQTLGEKNARVIEAQSALATARMQLQSQAHAIMNSLKTQVQAARETEIALQNALTSTRTAVQSVNRQEFQLGVLERDVQTNTQLYDLFLSRAKETSVSTNLQGAVARIVDMASPATAPMRPNKPQIIVSVLLVAVSACAIVSILIDKFSKTLKGSEQAEHQLRLPVLTTLPEFKATKGQSMTRLFLDKPSSGHADGIRAARTGMLLSATGIQRKLVLITSALAGEGKTTFSTNLAFAHAQTMRTLLIDCDLRNPKIGARMGLPSNAKGISDLVRGNAPPSECVHAISGSSLMVMPAGDLPEHCEEFLLSSAFRDALIALSNRVDIVLIDSPPLAVCSDALILSKQVNDTIYVVKANDTPLPFADRGLEMLRRAGANVLGLVLTNIDTPPSWIRRYERYADLEVPRRRMEQRSAVGA